MVAAPRSVTLSCRYQHTFTSSAKPGGTTHCPACRREGRGRIAVRVPVHAYDARRAGTQLGSVSEGARLAALWAAQAPAASWRNDLEGETGRECGECGGPLYWAGAHTVQICPARHADGKARKMPSPGAVERERQYASRRAQLARRAAGEAAPAGALSDAEAIELERRKGGLIGQLDALDGDHLSADIRRVLAWFRRQVDSAGSDRRLNELVNLFAETGIRIKRSWWPGRAAHLVLDGFDEDDQADDGADEDDQANDYPGNEQLAEIARQLGAIPGARAPSVPLCDPCYRLRRQRPAIRRIDTFGHGGQQGEDVCAEHDVPGAQVITNYAGTVWRALAVPPVQAAPVSVPGYAAPEPPWRAIVRAIQERGSQR